MEEAGLELEEMVVDAGANDFEGVIGVCEVEEAFTLSVGGCEGCGVEFRGEVVEDAEEIVVITTQLGTRRRWCRRVRTEVGSRYVGLTGRD